MDGLSLLHSARTLGLVVHTDRGRLVVRGPNRAEDIARALLARKPEVVGLLAGPALAPWPPEAELVFLESLGTADELGMDSAPGSPAWETAAREARRTAAAIPRALWTRERSFLDMVMETFEPLAPLRFLSWEPSGEGGAS